MPVSGVSRPLQLRLFLEGQEVPVIAANVSISLNAPAAASIQIVPLDEGMDLKPRTMVHLFFLDQLPSAADIEAAKAKQISEEDLQRAYYKLLFAGEVVGFAFGQTPLSRSLVLQCLDFTSYWDACHATAIEYGPGGNAFVNQSAVYASNAALFDDIVNFQAEKLVSWIRDGRPKTPGLQNVSGLAGGIITMLEAIGGVPGHNRGVNDFFTFAELRCRLLAQITAEENDKTAANILKTRVFDEWLRNGLQNIGQQVTFRDMMKLLCQYIYYDFVPNPAAKYDPSFDGGDEKTTSVTELRANPLAANVQAALTEINNNLISAQTFADSNAITNAATFQVQELDNQATILEKVGNAAKTVKSHVVSASNLLSSRILGFSSVTAVQASAAFAAASAEVAQALGSMSTLPKIVYETGVRSTATTARLRSAILRPDCFFSAAPRCNVIFPEHFAQVSYDRTYLSEVTRSLTMVYNTLVGRDALLADKVMAPNIGLDMKKVFKQAGTSGYRVLMPHERHTGIIPRSEWLPNIASFGKNANSGRQQQRGSRLTWVDRAALFHFFKYRLGPRRASVSGRFNPYLVCGFPSVVILKPFIIDQATMDEIQGASGTSNSTNILDLVQSNPIQLGAPFQIVGMIGGLTHSIDQSGGVTSVSLHHARRHLGVDDEFIGVFSESLNSIQKRIRVPVRADVAFAQKGAKNATSLVKILVGVTPSIAQKGRQKKSVTTISNQPKSVSYTQASVDPDSGGLRFDTLFKTLDQLQEKIVSIDDPFIQKGRIDKVDRDVLVPKPPGNLTTNSKGVHGKIVGVEVVDSDLVQVPSGPYAGKWVYRSVVLHEEVTVKTTVNVPIEEVIRPSWFSDNYSNPKIGEKIYMPFFGTTSIIDGLRFTGLVAKEIVTTDDPEGTTYDPTKKTEEIQKELADSNSIRSQLTIERAVNVIAYLYGLVKTGGKDVDQFIRDYASRPIASLVNILGTSNFAATYDARGVPSVATGKPGFHSLALDRKAIQQGNLAGLLHEPDHQLPRINNTGKREPISPVYDVRKEKLDRVDSYIIALKKGPGLRG